MTRRLTAATLQQLETARTTVEITRAAYSATRTIGAFWALEAAERELGRLVTTHAESLLAAARARTPCRKPPRTR